MDIAIRGAVGPDVTADGTNPELRQSKDSSLVVSPSHGDYYESTSRNQVFSGMTAQAGTTVVANNVSPVAAAVATVLSLYNPLNSGYNLELLKAWLTLISGTPPAGSWLYNVAFNQAITINSNHGGVAGANPQSNSGSGAAGQGKIFTQAALTGGVGAQNLLRPVAWSAFAAAISATTPVINFSEEHKGDIVIPPGGLLTLAPPATGTTLLVVAGFEWLEQKLPS